MVMDQVEKLNKARDCFKSNSWKIACNLFSEAVKQTPVDPPDLEQFAVASYLTGNDLESDDLLTRAHQGFLDLDKKEDAARCAFWLGFKLMLRGEYARGGGWISRAGRILEEAQLDCVVAGYLIIPAALQKLGEGNYPAAREMFAQALETGKRFGDPSLSALGRLGSGQSLIEAGEIEQGIQLLDETMAAVEADEVTPIAAGIIYCAVIEICQKIFDLHRAREWTHALNRWCESQPDLVPFRGQCLVRRAEIMQFQGTWKDAFRESEKACKLLSKPPGEPAAGEAYYRKGELCRIRGDFSKAEEAYQNASKWGREPQPGLALLCLAKGQTENSMKMALRLYSETAKRLKRVQFLPAIVEILLEAGDAQKAREAAEELNEIAAEINTPYLNAMAFRAYGSVLLAEGDADDALKQLRQSWSAWEKLEIPYESARCRVLIARACRDLGDSETAKMEFNAAKWVFQQLGAVPDIQRVDNQIKPGRNEALNGLTARQLEVLRLVAGGMSNREIAGKLFISERTVERHVSDIFNKLNVSSRSAATAYAYEHRLI
jgi:ATP/maltotriose-dependent transcriptional regulator MalT